MDSAIQQRIKPHVAPNAVDFSQAKVANPNALPEEGLPGPGKVSFKDLLTSSNIDTAQTRAAQQNGNGLAGAKTDEEFRKMLTDMRDTSDVVFSMSPLGDGLLTITKVATDHSA